MLAPLSQRIPGARAGAQVAEAESVWLCLVDGFQFLTCFFCSFIFHVSDPFFHFPFVNQVVFPSPKAGQWSQIIWYFAWWNGAASRSGRPLNTRDPSWISPLCWRTGWAIAMTWKSHIMRWGTSASMRATRTGSAQRISAWKRWVCLKLDH